MTIKSIQSEERYTYSFQNPVEQKGAKDVHQKGNINIIYLYVKNSIFLKIRTFPRLMLYGQPHKTSTSQTIPALEALSHTKINKRVKGRPSHKQAPTRILHDEENVGITSLPKQSKCDFSLIFNSAHVYFFPMLQF